MSAINVDIKRASQRQFRQKSGYKSSWNRARRKHREEWGALLEGNHAILRLRPIFNTVHAHFYYIQLAQMNGNYY